MNKRNNNRTYIGMTNNLTNRLSEHNSTKKSSKGAKYTKIGQPYKFVYTVTGFKTRSEACMFEWRWKRIRRIRKKDDGYLNRKDDKYFNIKNRVIDMFKLLNMDKWTSRSPLSHGYKLYLKHYT